MYRERLGLDKIIIISSLFVWILKIIIEYSVGTYNFQTIFDLFDLFIAIYDHETFSKSCKIFFSKKFIKDFLFIAYH